MKTQRIAVCSHLSNINSPWPVKCVDSENRLWKPKSVFDTNWTVCFLIILRIVLRCWFSHPSPSLTWSFRLLQKSAPSPLRWGTSTSLSGCCCRRPLGISAFKDVENQFKLPQEGITGTKGHEPLRCSLATKPWRRSKETDMGLQNAIPLLDCRGAW